MLNRKTQIEMKTQARDLEVGQFFHLENGTEYFICSSSGTFTSSQINFGEEKALLRVEKKNSRSVYFSKKYGNEWSDGLRIPLSSNVEIVKS